MGRLSTRPARSYLRSHQRAIAFGASFSFIISAMAPAFANPSDGVVRAGDASIHTNGSTLEVHQRSDRAVIDWKQFDIAPNEHTRFIQPSNKSVALNRIHGGVASTIAGSLSANGTIILVNPNGMVFSKGAKVNVGSLIATTSDSDNKAFMNGNMRFNKPGAVGASVVNQGTITAAEAGLVGLVAPVVVNSGVISAKLGKVSMASADTFTADLYGDGLYAFAVRPEAVGQLVAHSGKVHAEGGDILLTAAQGAKIVNSVVSVEGELHAPSVAERNGKIVIEALGSNAVAGNDAALKSTKSGQSNALINGGLLNVSGYKAGEKGGEIRVSADEIAIMDGSLLDASGHTGVASTQTRSTIKDDATVRTHDEFMQHPQRAGGSIRIGGDYLGTGNAPAARFVHVAPKAVLKNDAVHSGDGGRTIVWSDNRTDYHGVTFARGGEQGGHGGFLETSGKLLLNADGFAEMTAQEGYRKGTYLLDPNDIYIYGNVDGDFESTDGTTKIDNGDLEFWLDPGDPTSVTLTYSYDQIDPTTASGTLGAYTITMLADKSAWFEVGSRVRMGSAGAVATADTMGAHTYTVVAISPTTLTVAEPLQDNYSNVPFYRGLVSNVADKSGNLRSAFLGDDTRMPLYMTTGFNGRSHIYFKDTDYLRTNLAPITGNNARSYFMAVRNLEDNLVGGAGGYPIHHLLMQGSENWREAHGLTYTHADVDGIGTDIYWDGYASGTDVRGISALIGLTYDGANERYYVNAENVDTRAIVLNTGGANNFIINSALDPDSDYQHGQGQVGDILIFSGNVSDVTRNLLEQYQSGKWGFALTAPGTGTTEAEKAMAADGYSVFTTRYLERLSASADISLLATNSITMDFQDTSMTLANGRNLSLTTTNGTIAAVSKGVINTVNNGSGGNISLNAGGAGNISFADDFTLSASNGGGITLNAGGGSITANGDLSLRADSLNITGTLSGAGTGAFSFSGGSNATSVGVGSGGTPTVSLSNALVTQVKNTFDSYTIGRLDGGNITNYVTAWDGALSLLSAGNITNAVNSSSNNTVLLRAGGDIQLDGTLSTTSSTAHALVLSAGDDFLNNAGASALSASNSRWLVYSADPSGNTRDGLLPTASEFNKTYAGNAPATIGAGNRFVYATAVQPTLTLRAGSVSVEYGDAYTGSSVGYVSGLVGDDTLSNIGQTGAASIATAYNAGDAVGNYVGSLTATVGSLANPLGYQYAFNAADLAVTKAPVTVTLLDNAPTRQTGQANPDFTFSYSGFKLGQDSTVLDTLPTASTAAIMASPVGTYDITIAGGLDNNYDIQFTNPAGVLTITSADVVLSGGRVTPVTPVAEVPVTPLVPVIPQDPTSPSTPPVITQPSTQNPNIPSVITENPQILNPLLSVAHYVNGIQSAPLTRDASVQDIENTSTTSENAKNEEGFDYSLAAKKQQEVTGGDSVSIHPKLRDFFALDSGM